MKTARKGSAPRGDPGAIVTLSPRDYDAVLFDLDGVLTRTASVHARLGRSLRRLPRSSCRRTYQDMPPIPQRIVSTDGQVVAPDGTIQRGQAVWQTLGGMEVGSIWGHGSYVAPDWTADWLHRECELILGDWARSEHARSYAELGPEQQAAQPEEATSTRMALRAVHRLQPCPPSERGT